MEQRIYNIPELEEFSIEEISQHLNSVTIELMSIKQCVVSDDNVVDGSCPPTVLQNIDVTELVNQCQSYINEIIDGDYNDDTDIPHYIFESAMDTVFGKACWVWINKNT